MSDDAEQPALFDTWDRPRIRRELARLRAWLAEITTTTKEDA